MQKLLKKINLKSALLIGTLALTASWSNAQQKHPAEPEMVFVQGGTFMMGSPKRVGKDNERPQHQVTLSDFYIGKYEVTEGQWKAVMGNNPSHNPKGVNYPVENVSWNDVQEFIKKLNELTGKKYRLPTEAEWEYAASGGIKAYIYQGSNTDVAWTGENSGNDTKKIVGTKQPNKLDIYDMIGNVFEWCGDWYGDYLASPQTNPTGPTTGSHRVNRGGSWMTYNEYARVSSRNYYAPDISNNYLGFRLVLP